MAKRKISLLMFLIALAGNARSSKLRLVEYERITDGVSKPGVDLANTRSLIECAVHCSSDSVCRRFTYGAGACHIYYDTDSIGGSGITYGKRCPYSKGYAIFSMITGERCLKHNHLEKTYAEAGADCMMANAHIFTLKSLDDLVYFEGNQFPGPWVDGGTQSLTSSGAPLPWTPWRAGFPLAGECPVAVTRSNCMKTLNCTDTRKYICEF